MRRREKKEPAKYGVIFFHKNALSTYEQHWVDKCVRSIEYQNYLKNNLESFYIYDLNYGNKNIKSLAEITNRRLSFINDNYFFMAKEFENHVLAQNFLLDTAFKEHELDVVFNTNIDDYYSPKRFEMEISWIMNGYDLVSCDFQYIRENASHYDEVVQQIKVSHLNINNNLREENNIICHPGVAYTRDFWLKHGPYPNNIPREDLDLWKKAVNNGANIGIVPEVLVSYRRHKNQICK